MERCLGPGVPSQSLHPILCVARRGDNFSFEHVETEKRKGKRNAGGSAENLELGGSIRPGLIIRQQLGLTRLRVVLPGLSLLKEGHSWEVPPAQPSHCSRPQGCVP